MKTPSTNIPGKWRIKICLDGHPGTPPKNLSDNQFILVVKDRYTKLMRAMLMSKKTAYIVSLFMHDWVILYEFLPMCSPTTEQSLSVSSLSV